MPSRKGFCGYLNDIYVVSSFCQAFDALYQPWFNCALVSFSGQSPSLEWVVRVLGNAKC